MRGEIYENWLWKKVLDPLGFPQVLRIWGGGCSSKFEEGGLRQYMGEHGGRAALNAVKKYLWMSSFNSKVANYKPANY